MPTATLALPTPRKRAAATPAAAPPPAAVPARADAADPDKAYKSLVDATVVALTDVNRRTLEFYHDLGSRVNELLDSPKTYGDAKISKFVKDLTAAGKTKIDASTLYKAGKFNKNFTRAWLERMIKAGVTWKNVTFLVAAELPEPDRRQLVDRVEAGEIKQDQLKKAIDAKVGVSAAKGGKAKKPVLLMGRIAGMSGSLAAQLAEMDPFISKVQGVSAKTLAEYAPAIAKARLALHGMIKETKGRLAALDGLDLEPPAEPAEPAKKGKK